MNRSISGSPTISIVCITANSDTSLKLSTMNRFDADFGELIAGGQRYQFVPLPDSMVPTTVFVGNLCEFVTDEILSNFFRQVSTVIRPPACVARKPDTSSKKYGFVAFATVGEKEAAILRLSGSELNGRKIKVEPITDKPGQNRVRVPGEMVEYILGYIPKNKSSSTTTKKRSSHESRSCTAASNSQKDSSNHHRLHDFERNAFERATKKGYVTLESTGYRNGRKSSSLCMAHHQWCNDREKPQIVLCKASGGRKLDNIVVDLSPKLKSKDSKVDDNVGDDYEKFLCKQLTNEIFIAAEDTGMSLLKVDEQQRQDDSEKISIFTRDINNNNNPTKSILSRRSEASSKVNVFEGERSKAKAMARALARLWEVPQLLSKQQNERDGKSLMMASTSSNNWKNKNKGAKTKSKGLREHRKRRELYY